jgi:hypothetical protein
VNSLLEPLFGSTREAIRFAVNHHITLPRPQMNKLMADGKVMRIELADGSKITVAAPKGPPRSEQLRGLDGAATAGIILAHVARLADQEQLVVLAGSLPFAFPCSCRSPCCSGLRPNPDWQRSVLRLCDHLRDEAELSRVKGKKGMSTHPMMRRLLVEKFFRPAKELSLVELAERCDVTEQTVISHRRPIITFLERTTDAAWRNLDLTLGEAGLVGFIS